MVTRATQLGWRGEQIARRFLERRGLRFLHQHVRTRLGEVDLVMKDGKTIVFIEVKTRSNRSFGLPEEAVTPKKLKRTYAAATQYLLDHGWSNRDCRVDVVVVERSKISMVRYYQGISG